MEEKVFVWLWDSRTQMVWIIGPFSSRKQLLTWQPNWLPGGFCLNSDCQKDQCPHQWHCSREPLTIAQIRAEGVEDFNALEAISLDEVATWRSRAADGSVLNDVEADSALPFGSSSARLQELAVYVTAAIKLELEATTDDPPSLLADAIYTALFALEMPAQPGRQVWLQQCIDIATGLSLQPNLTNNFQFMLAAPEPETTRILLETLSDSAIGTPPPLGPTAPLSAPEIVMRIRTVFHRMRDELRVTNVPTGWTLDGIQQALAGVYALCDDAMQALCPCCRFGLLDTTQLRSMIEEWNIPALRFMLSQLGGRSCLHCAMVQTHAPDPAAVRWSREMAPHPAEVQQILDSSSAVSLVGYEVNGRGWLIFAFGSWYMLTTTLESTLHIWLDRSSIAPTGSRPQITALSA